MDIGGDLGLGVSSFLKEIKRAGSRNLPIAFQAPVIQSLEIDGWVRNQNDLQSTGDRGSAPATNGSILWEFETQNQRPVQGQPAIAEGYVYHGTGLGSGNISALNKLSLETGNLEWRAEIGGANDIRGTPHIVPNPGAPVVYFAGGGGDIYALDSSDGSVIWSNNPGSSDLFASDYSSVLVYNESLYVGGNNNNSDVLISVDVGDGSLNWVREYGDSGNDVPPATDEDGKVFAAGGDNLFAFAENGDQLWTYPTTDIQTGASVDGDGNIYFSNRLGEIISLDNDGNQRWVTDPGHYNPAKSGCLDDNNYYIAWTTGHVTSVSKADGSVNFDIQISQDQIYANLTVAQGTLYVGDYNGDFYAIDTATGNEIWSVNVGEEIRAGAATVDGGAIIGTQTSVSGHVYHIE